MIAVEEHNEVGVRSIERQERRREGERERGREGEWEKERRKEGAIAIKAERVVSGFVYKKDFCPRDG